MMHPVYLLGIGWRDMVLLLAAMTGVYLVLSLMRLFEMTAKRRNSPPSRLLVAPDISIGASGGQCNYRLPRRCGVSAACANAQSYEFEWHRRDGDRNGRQIESGRRSG